jgi:hypothetical protein
MCAQMIAECQRAAGVVAPGHDQVDLVRMRPFERPVEEGAALVVGMRHVTVAERRQGIDERRQRRHGGHRHLNVDDRLRGEAGDGRRPVMVDADRERSEDG